jgi:hypothetical protein
MDIAGVFDWFAQESKQAAEQTADPKQREILLNLAVMWAASAERCHDEAPLPTNTDDSYIAL